ncbi:MAG: type IV pilus secretin PilQ [Desulfobacteraceae bacterium]|nr:type IV pilus secretin PilQ [Desulfobacteraceae bacterium]
MNRAKMIRFGKRTVGGSKLFSKASALVWLAALSLFFGCAGKESTQTGSEDFMTQWRAKAETANPSSPGDSQAKTPLQSPPLSTSMETQALEAAGQEPQTGGEAEPGVSVEPSLNPDVERPLPTAPESLRMRDVDLTTLLRALARIADQNIMISEKVSGQASIDIHQAPWDEVFRGILSTHGLDYRWVGDIIRVVSVEDLRAEQDLLSETQKSREAVKEHAVKMQALRSEVKLGEPMVYEVVPIRFAELEALKENVQSILEATSSTKRPQGGQNSGQEQGGAERAGRILIDKHSHSLILFARESEVAKMRNLIEQLDKPTAQIRIEAQIVQTDQETARALGVRWGGIFLDASGERFNWYGGDPSASEGAELYDSTASPNFVQSPSDNIVSAFPDTLVGDVNDVKGISLGYLFQQKGIGLLSAQLRALEEANKLDVLSSPAITTLDNTEATIESGSEVPYETTDQGDRKVEFKDALLKLAVTPHVIDDEYLRLHILTSNDTVDESRSVGGQPFLNKQKAETSVVLYDGQTTVIGGLTIDSYFLQEEGVPFIKDIPLLGYLFKGKSKGNRKQEILYFITPYILKNRAVNPEAESAQP